MCEFGKPFIAWIATYVACDKGRIDHRSGL
jgi:hypothetical protein